MTWPKHFTEQQKEDEDEDRGTKEMQTKGLTDIISAIDMAAEKFCHTDGEWERNSTVKRGITAILHHYYEILQEKSKKSKQMTLHSFLMSSKLRPGLSSAI
jgi:hypothetical protein